jgi:hypothetical protein
LTANGREGEYEGNLDNGLTKWVRENSLSIMEALTEQLQNKLHQWRPETSRKVRKLVAEIIELADDDALEIGRSRGVEQEVLDVLDEPPAR